ncbi:hypothetical protein COB11_07415 [Candidatus Aerophobetes bacterium]|uniref:Uncharacterized protein n=1 Tax=Aerophobetes bacterium TaxID=2030807 RepID=A0A2A4YDM5_UNCAE|nr:MAG: hypothetical protein COB11_07415 [Candidatus Aerophobetes bacterium]
MKFKLIFALVLFAIGGQVFASKQEYVANLHEGNNNFLWYEGKIIFNRLDPHPDRNVYLRINKNSVHVRVLSRFGTREEDFKIAGGPGASYRWGCVVAQLNI